MEDTQDFSVAITGAAKSSTDQNKIQSLCDKCGCSTVQKNGIHKATAQQQTKEFETTDYKHSLLESVELPPAIEKGHVNTHSLKKTIKFMGYRSFQRWYHGALEHHWSRRMAIVILGLAIALMLFALYTICSHNTKSRNLTLIHISLSLATSLLILISKDRQIVPTWSVRISFFFICASSIGIIYFSIAQFLQTSKGADKTSNTTTQYASDDQCKIISIVPFFYFGFEWIIIFIGILYMHCLHRLAKYYFLKSNLFASRWIVVKHHPIQLIIPGLGLADKRRYRQLLKFYHRYVNNEKGLSQKQRESSDKIKKKKKEQNKKTDNTINITSLSDSSEDESALDHSNEKRLRLAKGIHVECEVVSLMSVILSHFCSCYRRKRGFSKQESEDSSSSINRNWFRFFKGRRNFSAYPKRFDRDWLSRVTLDLSSSVNHTMVRTIKKTPKHNARILFIGEADDFGIPHGFGFWKEDGNDYGERLVGYWADGYPNGPHKSRELGTGSGFMCIRIAWAQYRLGDNILRFGVANVECCVTGKFYRCFPIVKLLNPPELNLNRHEDTLSASQLAKPDKPLKTSSFLQQKVSHTSDTVKPHVKDKSENKFTTVAEHLATPNNLLTAQQQFAWLNNSNKSQSSILGETNQDISSIDSFSIDIRDVSLANESINYTQLYRSYFHENRFKSNSESNEGLEPFRTDLPNRHASCSNDNIASFEASENINSTKQRQNPSQADCYSVVDSEDDRPKYSKFKRFVISRPANLLNNLRRRSLSPSSQNLKNQSANIDRFQRKEVGKNSEQPGRGLFFEKNPFKKIGREALKVPSHLRQGRTTAGEAGAALIHRILGKHYFEKFETFAKALYDVAWCLAELSPHTPNFGIQPRSEVVISVGHNRELYIAGWTIEKETTDFPQSLKEYSQLQRSKQLQETESESVGSFTSNPAPNLQKSVSSESQKLTEPLNELDPTEIDTKLITLSKHKGKTGLDDKMITVPKTLRSIRSKTSRLIETSKQNFEGINIKTPRHKRRPFRSRFKGFTPTSRRVPFDLSFKTDDEVQGHQPLYKDAKARCALHKNDLYGITVQVVKRKVFPALDEKSKDKTFTAQEATRKLDTESAQRIFNKENMTQDCLCTCHADSKDRAPDVPQAETIDTTKYSTAKLHQDTWDAGLSFEIPELEVQGWKCRDVVGSPEVLVYIHGYNNSHIESLQILGQMAAFGNYPNHIRLFVFAWPSGKNFFDFYKARKAAEDSRTHKALGRLFQSLRANGISQIHVMCHSMGSRLFLKSFRSLSKLIFEEMTGAVVHGNKQNENVQKESELPISKKDLTKLQLVSVTFLNPEYFLDEFVSEDYTLLHSFCDHITIFADAKDQALWWSEKFSGRLALGKNVFGLWRPIPTTPTKTLQTNPKDPLRFVNTVSFFRLGSYIGRKESYSGGDGRTENESQVEWLDIDVIDTTFIDQNVHSLRHSFWNLNREIIEDIRDLMMTRKRARQRSGRLDRRDGNVWVYRVAPAYVTSIFDVSV